MLLLLASLASAGTLDLDLGWTHQHDELMPNYDAHRLRGRVGYELGPWGLEAVADLPLHKVWGAYCPLIHTGETLTYLPVDSPRTRAELALSWQAAQGVVSLPGERELGLRLGLRAGAHLTKRVQGEQSWPTACKILVQEHWLPGPLLGVWLEVEPLPWLSLRVESGANATLHDDLGADWVTAMSTGLRL